MRLFALSAGIEVPTRSFSGITHSIFDRACNIRLETDALITLVTSETGNLPTGLRLETPPRFTFSHFIRAREPAACRGGTIRFGLSDLSIDLRTATGWHIDLSGLRIDLRRNDQAEAWMAAWHELRMHQRGDTCAAMIGAVARNGWGPVTPVERAIRTVPALLDATRNLQVTKACASIMPLIGLGSGLTPSGDDFLVGYLAGLWSAAGREPSRLRFLASVGAWLSGASAETNVISRSYIKSAVRGHASEPLTALAQRLSEAGDMDRVRAATVAALQVGHSSGAEGVAGLLFGCAIWSGHSCRPIAGRATLRA